jgi:hypothetical protein
MPLPTSHMFVVPSSPTSGHRTLKPAGLIHREHAIITHRGPFTLNRFETESGQMKVQGDSCVRDTLSRLVRQQHPIHGIE